MKNAVFLIVGLFVHQAYALCDHQSKWDGNTLTSTQCETAGGSVASAAAAGYLSARKFGEANSIEVKNTVEVYGDASGKHLDLPALTKVVDSLTDGDHVTVDYQLNEADNRAYHIKLMHEKSDQAASDAVDAKVESESKTTTRQVSNYDWWQKKYVETTVSEPDVEGRKEAAHEEVRLRKLAAQYASEAEKAEKGGAVPTYTLSEMFTDKVGTGVKTATFAKERIVAGGKILSVKRLAVGKVLLAHSARVVGAGLLGAAAVGAAVAGEEALNGAAAKALDQKAHPAMADYSKGSYK